MCDACRYAETKEEIDKWRERDPIEIHTKKLIERGTLSESECKEIEKMLDLCIQEGIFDNLN